MTDAHDGFLAVNSGLVRQTLVEALFGQVEKRSEERPEEAIAAVLEAAGQAFTVADEIPLDHGLRHFGYLARVVEADLFEPARLSADWVPAMLTERFALTGSWSRALTEACGDLARLEPLGKPSPDDETAMTWRVPGPGGHVRHYLARRTIEEHLREREEAVAGDPAELKRPWLYGFFVRACEEALPDGAVLDAPA
ncbi:MAG: hypothetical protein H0T43_01505 [Solirubrobacterales bacterium]|nr:hypothetical protein [Solirubrobacterales bacterium]